MEFRKSTKEDFFPVFELQTFSWGVPRFKRVRDLLHALDGERRIGDGPHGNGHELGGVVIAGHAVGAQRTALSAAMDDGPLAVIAHPDGDGFHDAAAVRVAIAGNIIHVHTVQAIRTMIPMVASRALRYHFFTAVSADEGLLTGMVHVIALFHLLGLFSRLDFITVFAHFITPLPGFGRLFRQLF